MSDTQILTRVSDLARSEVGSFTSGRPTGSPASTSSVSRKAPRPTDETHHQQPPGGWRRGQKRRREYSAFWNDQRITPPMSPILQIYWCSRKARKSRHGPTAPPDDDEDPILKLNSSIFAIRRRASGCRPRRWVRGATNTYTGCVNTR